MLRFFCIAVPVATIAVAASLYFSRGDSSFDLSALLALAILFLGNLISLALNVSFVRRAAGPTWLKGVIALQAMPVIVGAAMLGSAIADHRSEREAYAQADTVRAAIAVDDIDAFKAAWEKCEDECRRRAGGVNAFLYQAADGSASKIVAMLLAPPFAARDERLDSQRTTHACDGETVGVWDALGAAISRNDRVSFALLLPLADEGSRRSAMWLAAELDRLGMMQTMLAAGVPISLRGESLDENETLVVAAARGAAIRVGRWLIEEKSMPVDRIKNGPDRSTGDSPLSIVLRRRNYDADSLKRTRAFVKLLADHGADIDAPWNDDTATALAEKVRVQNRELALLLLDVGARKDRLTAERQVQLAALIASPPRERSSSDSKDCVAPGD